MPARFLVVWALPGLAAEWQPAAGPGSNADIVSTFPRMSTKADQAHCLVSTVPCTQSNWTGKRCRTVLSTHCKGTVTR